MVTTLTQAATHGLPLAIMDLDYSYAPDFLLPAPFKNHLVKESNFKKACASGFESYFEELVGYDEQGQEIFVKQGYTWDEVVAFLVEWVEDFRNPAAGPHRMSLAWLAGFTLGWLSALAVFRSEDAWRAMVVLAALLGPAAMFNGKP